MKKTTVWQGAQGLLVWCLLGGCGVDAAASVWYISPDGRDANAGTTPATAFGSFPRAQQSVRSRAVGTPAEVRVLPGRYHLNETLQFDTKDGGAATESQVTWTGWTPSAAGAAAGAGAGATSSVSFGIPVEGKQGWVQDATAPSSVTRSASLSAAHLLAVGNGETQGAESSLQMGDLDLTSPNGGCQVAPATHTLTVCSW
jgi:hypothetical protein